MVVSRRRSRDGRLGWDRTSAFESMPTPRHEPDSGPAKQRVVCGGDFCGLFPATSWCVVLFLKQTTLDLASNSLSELTERLGGKRKPSRQTAGGVLGSVVLFAVGFIAQNAIDLVDNGRRQFWKDLCAKMGAIQNLPPRLAWPAGEVGCNGAGPYGAFLEHSSTPPPHNILRLPLICRRTLAQE